MKSKLLLPLLLVFVAVATMSYDRPKGWVRGGNSCGLYSYDMGNVVGAGKNGKSCATIKALGCSNTHRRHCREIGHGDLMQNFEAGKFRGQRVRLTGWMRSEDAGTGGIWMQVHGSSYCHNYCSAAPCNNMDNVDGDNSLLEGTKPWTKLNLVVDVPEGASSISYGARLYGGGQIWFENMKIEIVSRNVRTTGLPLGYNWVPTNMKFQRK